MSRGPHGKIDSTRDSISKLQNRKVEHQTSEILGDDGQEQKKSSPARVSLPRVLSRGPHGKIDSTRESISRPANRKVQHQTPETSEDEQPSNDESSGMSDFIVDDDDSIFGFSDNEEDSILPSPPRPSKSPRKLVRGRRPERRELTDEEIFDQINRLGLDVDIEDVNELGELVSGISFGGSREREGGAGDDIAYDNVRPGSQRGESGKVLVDRASPSRGIDIPPLKKPIAILSSSLDIPEAVLK